MKQKKYPCCKESMTELDVLNVIGESGAFEMSYTCPTFRCRYCGTELIGYIKVDYVEVQ